MTTAKKGTRKKQSRGELRSEATRQALLDSARTLIAEKGMDLTTIDDITQQADVGKGTFYYYFRNKNAIVRELIKRMIHQLDQAIEVKCADATELEEVLESLITAHLEFFDKRWEDFVLFFQGRADLTLQQGYEGIDTPFVEYLDRIGTLIDQSIEHQLSKNMLTRISCAVAGFVSGYYSFATIASEESDLDEILRPVRLALVAGLSRFIKETIPRGNSSVRW